MESKLFIPILRTEGDIEMIDKLFRLAYRYDFMGDGVEFGILVFRKKKDRVQDIKKALKKDLKKAKYLTLSVSKTHLERRLWCYDFKKNSFLSGEKEMSDFSEIKKWIIEHGEKKYDGKLRPITRST